MLDLIRGKINILDKIVALRKAISNSKVYAPPHISTFVFLCGANQSHDEISERRKALMKFADSNLPHTQFFLAEKMFATLRDEGHKGNILDIEHKITQFADYVVIVLESQSAFAELGAFSHSELRNKLIIINDSAFTTAKSFINLGPLKAIEEASGKERILSYQMTSDGIFRRDAIGDVYSDLYGLLGAPQSKRSTPLRLKDCNPATNINKYSAMFVHDLVYLTGAINNKELAVIATQLFGHADFKLSEHMAILTAFGSLERTEGGIYKSRRRQLYFDYRYDINSLIATFRNYLQKSCPERIYGH